ncbi:MAG: o-succinylbenzoate synthase [Candidatus Marinimicrobia bacterium]|nr:o-succinylbenzoate synthase [Candidatus Neomarinimicrobiota bacterium]MCF7850516.1 o-succinylbenzoate synthase [Candidatus Neomarinimicrobiota bacterium]MCF7903971.1 o-succinylbenzoate synthase [Candidatus Neomarinimicrobiota bacterium]
MEVDINQIFGVQPEFTGKLKPLDLRSASLYRFSLPLKQPLVLINGQLSRREGVLVVLNKDEANIGLGEISPLPGFSQDSLTVSVSKATHLLQTLMRSESDLLKFLNRGGNWEEMNAPSIANFGVETALLSLLANANDLHLGSLLFEDASATVPMNALINTDLADWEPESQRLVEQGYSTLKIKVGRINHELEAIGVQRVRAAVGPQITLRLDANRSWDMETAVEFGKSVESANIEYIEEPLIDSEDLPIFFDACGLHFAFDETLHHIIDPGISFNAYTGLKALVLKPSLVACIPRILELVSQARKQGLLTVISSSFESDVGINNLAQFAAGISGDTTAVGLGTESIFSKTLSTGIDPVHSGRRSIRVLGMNDLDLDDCELIYEQYI